MSRAYIVYILMFAVLIGGLSVLLTYGAAMKAPDDLSGEWIVRWENSPPEFAAKTMRVEQSGRYLNVRFGDRKPIAFTLSPGWKGSSAGRNLQMTLENRAWTMRLSGEIRAQPPRLVEEARVELSETQSTQTSPPQRAQYVATARRVLDIPTTRPAGLANAR